MSTEQTLGVSVMPRDYSSILDLAASIGAADVGREDRMRLLVDALWDAFGADEPATGCQAVSWIGFYIAGPDVGGEQTMVLGPSRNKPACSPIGVHGACGQGMLRKSTLVVRDVASLGEGYIACDPRDRSELVIPVIDDAGVCDAVLDADSFDVGAFTRYDAEQIAAAMERADLLHRAASVPIDVI